jgi:hypothetical protein
MGTQEIKYDKDAALTKGDKIYFEGSPYAESFNRKAGVYILGDWDGFYGYELLDTLTMEHIGWVDATTDNTHKIIE